MNTTKTFFDHEKLIAYQRSIQFVVWSSALLEKLPAKLAVSDQLERASTSVSLNIAEGNAKYTTPDRCRYFDTARGSALECAACLDVLVAKGKCTAAETQRGKEILQETVSLLVGLIRSIDADRLGEQAVNYRTRTKGRGRTNIINQPQADRSSLFLDLDLAPPIPKPPLSDSEQIPKPILIEGNSLRKKMSKIKIKITSKK